MSVFGLALFFDGATRAIAGRAGQARHVRGVAQKSALVTAAVLALATPVIVHFEGDIRRGYRDPIGIVTACSGHTKTAQLGKTYTAQECRDLLARDLEEHNAGLLTCVKAPMPPEVHAAMLSWAFNVGVNNACRSTAIKKLNAGDFTGACNELLKWTLAGGRELPGLVRRRQAENRLCLGQPLPLEVTR